MPEAGAAPPPAGTDPPVDLTRPRVVHVVGVGGPGMSAIATALAGMGHRVSGSDLKDLPVLARLRGLGIEVHVGHDPANVGPDVEYVATSTAIPPRNVEVAAARERGVPVLRRAEILAAIAATRRTVAVAGTHGKTTTSSMLALVLVEAGVRPSFLIGADVNEIGAGAAWDEGPWFVVEADESDGTFLELPRQAAVVTNVEADHLEFYGTVEAMEAAYADFAAGTGGPVLACADDPGSARLAQACGALTYGVADGADFRMDDLASGANGTSFDLVRDGERLGAVRLPLAGAHNARNACAAVAAGLLLGAPFEAGQAAMARFAGVSRRFEHRGEAAGVSFVDDYAHLPTEVAAALSAAVDGGWSRVVAVFQPHRYSRTEALGESFADAFQGAGLLVVTDVYPAGEAPRPGVSGKLVVDAVLDAHPRTRLAYLPRRADVVAYLAAELRPGDLCLTLGAGDVTALPDELQERLAARPGGEGQGAARPGGEGQGAARPGGGHR